MNREEHVAWCKKRAHEYLERLDIENAIASMLSDMGKHPDCGVNSHITVLGMMTITDGDVAAARRFIDGLN